MVPARRYFSGSPPSGDGYVASAEHLYSRAMPAAGMTTGADASCHCWRVASKLSSPCSTSATPVTAVARR